MAEAHDNNGEPEPVPMNQAYAEGIDLGEALFDDHRQRTASWDTIDWKRPIETPDEVVQATTTAATQFHYANTSQLILCGKILRYEATNTTIDVQRLAAMLAVNRIETIDVWGRYLGTLGATTNVSPPLKQYYQHLLSKDDALSILIGIETLGGPVAATVYDTLQNKGDMLFQQIVRNMRTQKHYEQDTVIDVLRPTITALSAADQQGLSDRVATYTRIIERILAAHQAELETLHVDLHRLQDEMATATTEFHDRLGLRP